MRHAYTTIMARSATYITQLLQPIPNRKPINTAHQKTIRVAAEIVSTWGTEYKLAARGLSELQVKRACDKAYLETFNQMQIITDHIGSTVYEPEFIATFKATIDIVKSLSHYGFKETTMCSRKPAYSEENNDATIQVQNKSTSAQYQDLCSQNNTTL